MKNLIYFLITITWNVTSFAQSFEQEDITPFNIEVVNIQNVNNLAFKYLFYDNDNDGDYDLILMGLGQQDTTTQNIIFGLNYFVEFQENTGSSTMSTFAHREDLYQSFQFPTGEGFMIPDGGDLNNDGRIDFIVSAESDLYGIQYLQLHIQNSDGSFTVTNCLDWDLDPFLPYSLFIPELADLDSDGDLDILMCGYYKDFDEYGDPLDVPAYLYAKNIGTPSNPKFVGWYENPYGLSPDEPGFLVSGDLDLDGDIDLLNLTNGDEGSIFSFIENIGTTTPEFAEPVLNPFNLPSGSEEENYLFSSLVDLDNDGDLDLFVPVNGDETFELRYYQNNLLSSSHDLAIERSIIVYPVPTNDIVQINNKTDEPISSIKVFDASGRLHISTYDSSIKSIDLSNFDEGAYFIQFDFGNSKLIKKVIIIH